MNDLRTAIVGIVAVTIGFAGAWMVFGARNAQLTEENSVLRQQTGQLIQQIDDQPNPEALLVGRWATMVDKTRLGKIELIFELREDRSVRWESIHANKVTDIARGTWKLVDHGIHFAVTIVDERSPEKGQKKTTIATIKELGQTCLTLEVDGAEWVFHRAAQSS